MAEGTCFFIGHHDAGTELLPVMKDAIERHITEYGVVEFCVGHYGNFDRMATRLLTEAKVNHPEISIHLLTPYHPIERPLDVPEGFDATFYPPGMESVPRQYAISKANRYMIQNSTHLIAYAYHTLGGAGKLVKSARVLEKKGAIHIENLAEKIGQKAI